MKTAKQLTLAGLVLLAGGGIFYNVSMLHGEYGLYVAGAGLLLLLVAAFLARAKLGQSLAGRTARLGLGAGLSVLVVVALVFFLGSLAGRHHLRWDFSASGVHTLAPQTRQVLAGLGEPVKAYAFFREAQAGRAEAQAVLDNFAFASPAFTYQFVDPDSDPGLAMRFKVRTYGTVVLTQGERQERVQLPEEENLTNALVRLTKPGQKVVYFLTGHGESGLDDIGKEGLGNLKKAVEGENYVVKALLLATSQRVPPDAAVVVAAGPQKPYTAPELARLADYLNQGGGLLLLLEPKQDAGLKDWLQARGVILAQDLVLDNASRLQGLSPAAPLAVSYGAHPLTKGLEGIFCFFPLARSVELAQPLPPGEEGVSLVQTSPASWAETDFASLEQGQAEYQEGVDRQGPISLAVAVTLPAQKEAAQAAGKEGDQAKAQDQAAAQDMGQDKAQDKGQEKEPAKPADSKPVKGNLVVVGDTSFVDNTYLDQGGNRDLVMNTIGFLAEEQDLIAIRPKSQASQPLLLQPEQARLIFWLPVVIWPLVFVVAGVLVWLSRRRPA
ncbi:MAG: GldG family protein [Deltaproteobacteria bacterium]|nr:GldG family protein [Deltaproteobacteria bacterium]